MARPQTITTESEIIPVRAERRTSTWANSHGTYISGRAYIDEADMTATEMDAKWGIGRLRRLVGPELREKFDRQRYLFNQATSHGGLEDIRREAGRMVKAWLALDRAVEASGRAKPIDPQVWEVALSDGLVVAIVPDNDHAHRVVSDGRRMTVYTLAEIAKLLEANSLVHLVKIEWPGAKVVASNRNPPGDIDGVSDTSAGLDEILDEEIPF